MSTARNLARWPVWAVALVTSVALATGQTGWARVFGYALALAAGLYFGTAIAGARSFLRALDLESEARAIIYTVLTLHYPASIMPTQTERIDLATMAAEQIADYVERGFTPAPAADPVDVAHAGRAR